MKRIVVLITTTLIIWILSSIIGGTWNPMEWTWYWRVITIIYYLATLDRVLEEEK